MDSIDWSRLIVALSERLIISQTELAQRCDVAQQTVSSWKTGKNSPGIYARRQLMKLADEAGLSIALFSRSPEYYGGVEKRNGDAVAQGLSEDVMEFARFFQKLPRNIQDEVRAFAAFKLSQYQKSISDLIGSY